MLKKIFCAAFLCAAILFVGNAKVSAQDVWVYNDGRSDYYVMTETFNQRERFAFHFDVNVKYVRNGSLLATKTYSFDGHDVVSYRIDGIDKGYTYNAPQSAQMILSYCVKHFGLSSGMGEG